MVAIDEALKVITETKANNVEGGAYIVPRDMAFFKRS